MNKIDNSGKKAKESGQESKKFPGKCNGCGKVGHKKRECKSCFNCKKYGHRAKDCRLKKEKESNQSNFIINNVTDGKKSKLYLPLSFPGASSTVMFECDTGSYYTLIRKELLPKGYKLGPAPEQLKSATGHPLKTIGTTRIQMTYKGEKVPLEVVGRRLEQKGNVMHCTQEVSD